MFWKSVSEESQKTEKVPSPLSSKLAWALMTQGRGERKGTEVAMKRKMGGGKGFLLLPTSPRLSFCEGGEEEGDRAGAFWSLTPWPMSTSFFNFSPQD